MEARERDRCVLDENLKHRRNEVSSQCSIVEASEVKMYAQEPSKKERTGTNHDG
jgi:hypothetical protein